MLNITSDNHHKERLARFISDITIAPLIAIPLFVVINYFTIKEPNFYLITLLSIFFAGLLPILTSFLWIQSKKIEIDMPKKEDRTYPLLMVIISYLIGVIVLYAIHAPPITTALMFCYFSNTVIVMLISKYWKISIHSMGRGRAFSCHNICFRRNRIVLCFNNSSGYVEQNLS